MTTSILSPLVFPQNLLPDMNEISMHLPSARILWPSPNSTFFVVSPVHLPFSIAFTAFASRSSPTRFFSDSGHLEGMVIVRISSRKRAHAFLFLLAARTTLKVLPPT